MVSSYKALARVELAFRAFNTDLDIRPIRHPTKSQVRVSRTGYVDEQGRRRDYSSAFLRRTYRDGGKVKNETAANLSALPDHVIDLIDAGLKGQQLVPAAEAVQVRFTGTRATIPMLPEPTSVQHEAFTLLGTAIPLTLT